VRRHVEEIAALVLTAAGASPEAGAPALATLSRSAAAMREWADGVAAADHLDWPRAERHFAAAVDADPQFALAHYHRARALGWMGGEDDLAESERSYREALRSPERLSPDDREKAELVLEVLLGAAPATARGHVARARTLSAAQRKDKDALETWMEIAYHHRMEGSAVEAIEACEKLLELDPNYGPANQHLLRAALFVGRSDRAREAAERIVRTAAGSSWEPEALLLLGRLDEARARATDRGRNARTRWDRFAAIGVALGLGDAALAESLTAEGWSGNADSFAIERARALLGLARFDEARALLARTRPDARSSLLRLECGVEPPVPADGDRWESLLRAGFLARSGSAEEATKLLEGVPGEDRTAPALRRLADWVEGEIELRRGSTSTALDRFAAAAPERGQIENEDVGQFGAFLVQRAARAFLEAGRHADAERFARRLEEEPECFLLGTSLVSRIRAHYDVARAREATGDSAEALRRYETFLARWSRPDPAAPEIEDALRRYEALAGRPWGPD
jgi:tetratricopeptide (TPR) repeat protein